MPERVREEVRGLVGLLRARRSTVVALQVLLRWPHRFRTNAALLLALPLLVFVWPAAAIFFDEFLQYRRLFDWRHGVALMLFATSATTGLFLLARSQATTRRAVSLTFARFGARPPVEEEGEGARCRRCGAHLARQAESPLSRCIYCDADNVIGLGLSSWGAPEVEQAESLDVQAAAAVGERRRWRRLSAIAFLLLAISAALLHRPVADAAGSGSTARLQTQDRSPPWPTPAAPARPDPPQFAPVTTFSAPSEFSNPRAMARANAPRASPRADSVRRARGRPTRAHPRQAAGTTSSGWPCA